MNRTLVLGLILPVLAGCAGVHREIPYTSVTDGPVLESKTIPIRLARVRVSEGGFFRPTIYWKPSAWRLLALPADSFKEKVRSLVQDELDHAGFSEDPAGSFDLDVKIEEMALFTRGEERGGYRQGYARLRFTLRAPDDKRIRHTEEGEARFAGSGVQRSEGGSLFRSVYVYDRKDPKPMDYAVRLAARSFLDHLK